MANDLRSIASASSRSSCREGGAVRACSDSCPVGAGAENNAFGLFEGSIAGTRGDPASRAGDTAFVSAGRSKMLLAQRAATRATAAVAACSFGPGRHLIFYWPYQVAVRRCSISAMEPEVVLPTDSVNMKYGALSTTYGCSTRHVCDSAGCDAQLPVTVAGYWNP